MQDKKQIGKKIWELFSKDYTYNQIAKELGVSKSVVSNVINYSLPDKEWCDENIKELKEKNQKELLKFKNIQQNLQKKIKILKLKCKEKLNTTLTKTALISSILATLLIAVIPFLIVMPIKYYYFLNRIYYASFIYKAIGFILLATFLFFIFKYVSKFIIFITSFDDEI